MTWSLIDSGDAPDGEFFNDLQGLWTQKLDGPQSVTSSTTLVNCTQMVLTPDTSKTYRFTAEIFYTAGATGDIKIAWTFPAGAALYAGASGYGAAGNLVQFSSWLAAASGTTARFEGATAAVIFVAGSFAMGSTAGNLQLQFAQDTSNGTATQILSGSQMRLIRVA